MIHGGNVEQFTQGLGAVQGERVGLLLNFNTGQLALFKMAHARHPGGHGKPMFLGILINGGLTGELVWSVELRSFGDEVAVERRPPPPLTCECSSEGLRVPPLLIKHLLS